MDVFHGNVEAVETAGFGYLNFLAKSHHQVFILDAIAGASEGQHVRNEAPLHGLQDCPVLQVLGKRPLLSCPEGSSAFLSICRCHGIPWKGDKAPGFSLSRGSSCTPILGPELWAWLTPEDAPGGLAGQYAGATEAGGMLSLSARLVEPLQR